jgi:hypothetical protein
MAKNQGADGANGGGAPPVSTSDQAATTPNKTPREWNKELNSDPSRHAAASFLHGWGQHEHHYQDAPLKLTKEDYEAALTASFSYPCEPPHAPALSPCVKEKFAKFVPAPKTEKSGKETQKRGKPAPIQQPEKAERN